MTPVYYEDNSVFGMIGLTALCFISCFLFEGVIYQIQTDNRIWPHAESLRRGSHRSWQTHSNIHSTCVLKPNMRVCVCVCKYVLWGIHFLSFSLMACTGLPAPLLRSLPWWGQLQQATKTLSLHVVLSHGALGEFGLVPPPARGPVSFLFSSRSCLDSNGSLSTLEALRWNMFSPLLFSGWTKTGHTLLGPPPPELSRPLQCLR